MENKNVTRFEKFQNLRKNKIHETVIAVDDIFKVKMSIEVPSSLVNAYVKKVKDESGQNIKQMYSDMELAEEIAKYIGTNFMTIENIPVSIVLGTDYKGGGAQSQSQLDMQMQPQTQGQPQAQVPQPQAQVPQPQGVQPGAQAVPAPQPGAQQTPQSTAQQVPPQEI